MFHQATIHMVYVCWNKEVKWDTEKLHVCKEKEGGKGLNNGAPHIQLVSEMLSTPVKWSAHKRNDNFIEGINLDEDIRNYKQDQRIEG